MPSLAIQIVPLSEIYTMFTIDAYLQRQRLLRQKATQKMVADKAPVALDATAAEAPQKPATQAAKKTTKGAK